MNAVLIFLVALPLAMPPAAKAQAKKAATPAPAPVRAPAWMRQTSEDCARCHGVIVDEWRASMHAHSTPERDPLYRAVRKRAVKVLGARAERRCARCHLPRWAEQARAAGVKLEGVGCTTCHRVPDDHEDRRTPTRLAVPAPNPKGPSGLCLTCHGELKMPDGRPVCITGAEAEKVGQGGCPNCHMEREKGGSSKGSRPGGTHAGHRFPGGHVPGKAQEAASLELRATRKGTIWAVEAKVKAEDVGHAFPTGTPLRHAVVLVEALDGSGKVLWRNFEADPIVTAPEAVMMRKFVGPDGKKPVPPFLSKKPAIDTRLPPDGERSVRYEIPAPKATRLRATLTYHLAPPALLRKAGVPESWRKPTVVGRAEIELR